VTRATQADRIEEISNVVFGYASLKFAARAGILDDGSALDGLACAVNMLGEELAEAMTSLEQAQAELRRSEEQLRHTQKMEAVGRLAGGVAHDFNNILSVILTTSHLLLEDLPADSAMREDVEQISIAGERGARLTQQLLVFSRQEVIAPAKVDLGLTLNSLGSMLRVMVGEDVELAITSQSRLPAILAGPSHLEQVIMNLTVNARDAMSEGGKIAIEASVVERDVELDQSHPGAKPGRYVLLALSDTGSGMDEATRTRIFEPFFTTKDVGKGTGLGLSIVFGIVQQCGGWIEVDSEVGVGTTFRIYFPVTEGVVVKHGLLATRLPTGRGETILLVEDEPQVRHVAHSILRRCGYDVLVASGANEALALCEQHGEIALLLTDVVMPLTSGPELARLLADRQPDLKTLFMSGYTNDAVFRHGLLASGAAYLQKPLTPHSLATKVRELLDVLEPAGAQPSPG
jgi:two-component system cell cycle sensor histidine kinase/response regulator CckA